jgi:hypothetical protein
MRGRQHDHSKTGSVGGELPRFVRRFTRILRRVGGSLLPSYSLRVGCETLSESESMSSNSSTDGLIGVVGDPGKATYWQCSFNDANFRLRRPQVKRPISLRVDQIVQPFEKKTS